jgi:hypothetical protein
MILPNLHPTRRGIRNAAEMFDLLVYIGTYQVRT